MLSPAFPSVYARNFNPNFSGRPGIADQFEPFPFPSVRSKNIDSDGPVSYDGPDSFPPVYARTGFGDYDGPDSFPPVYARVNSDGPQPQPEKVLND